ncbi:hypothetical protein [Actinoplanes solisilvae]|uniref:hypothetical protein n=1 Tax=Actinoplanes solisilvae TaxID=2486853 RepID=UPI000FDC8DCD|nr:hypothetical protein [Actinoplanes solisilvae]
MPNEVERAFAALSSDADRGLLLSGPELRRQAGRRRSRAAVVTAGATAALAAAAIGGGFALAGGPDQRTVLPPAVSASPAPATTAPPTPTPSVTTKPPVSSAPPSSPPPSSTGPAIPKSIPGRALLTKDDVGNSEFKRLDETREVPEFCAKAKFPSQKQVGAGASVFVVYRGPKTPAENVPDDTIYDTVTVYRGEGAQDYLAELRAAVDVCPTGKIGDLEARFESLGSLGLGDESLLIERSYEARGGDGEPTGDGERTATYIAAVRVNDAVTLVDSRGYENWGTERSAIESLARAATKRLQGWRG